MNQDSWTSKRKVLHFHPVVCVLSLLLACPRVAQGERIYIMNGLGYNQADQPLIDAIVSLGHTVDLSAPNATTLPSGFQSTCLDQENGYHWLCFFGNQDFTPLIAQVQAFVLAGGKVLLQYEVDCCPIASQSAAEIATAVTGLNILPNSADYMAAGLGVPGWEAIAPARCLNITGNAYKCMDGIPAGRSLNATANLNGSEPSWTECPNFGFVFQPDDLPGISGGIVGIGDVNIYYEDAGEPLNNGGTDPVDMNAVEFLFGSPINTCTLLPMGCLASGTAEFSSPLFGTFFPNPANDHIIVPATVPGSVDLIIHDAIGHVVVQRRSQGEPLIAIPTNHIPAGVYHLSLRQGDRHEAATFVVEH